MPFRTRVRHVVEFAFTFLAIQVLMRRGAITRIRKEKR